MSPTEYDGLSVEVRDAALWLTLDQPETFNALTGEMVIGLVEELRGAVARDDVRVVVLTGTGAAFSAGADLSGDAPQEKYDATAVDAANALIRAIVDCDKPVVCGLNGVAAGVGMSVALACDLVVAKASAALTLGLHQDRPDARRWRDRHRRGGGRARPGDAAGAALRPDRRPGGVRRRAGLARVRRRRLRGGPRQGSSAAGRPDRRSPRRRPRRR